MSAHKNDPTLYSEQEIANESFNDKYKIIINANYGYDATTDSFIPFSLNTDGDTPNPRTDGGLTPYAKVLTGNDTITPSSGKKLQVNWVAFVPDSDNTSANKVTVGFNGGSTLYIGYAIAHWEPFVGNPDQVLNITLANSQPVSVMIQYKEL